MPTGNIMSNSNKSGANIKIIIFIILSLLVLLLVGCNMLGEAANNQELVGCSPNNMVGGTSFRRVYNSLINLEERLRSESEQDLNEAKLWIRDKSNFPCESQTCLKNMQLTLSGVFYTNSNDNNGCPSPNTFNQVSQVYREINNNGEFYSIVNFEVNELVELSKSQGLQIYEYCRSQGCWPSIRSNIQVGVSGLGYQNQGQLYQISKNINVNYWCVKGTSLINAPILPINVQNNLVANGFCSGGYWTNRY